MRTLLSHGFWAFVLNLVGEAGFVVRADPEKIPAADRIALLLKRLGAASFHDREAAGRALEAVGESALAPLRHAEAHDEDGEVRRRAGEVRRRILKQCLKSASTGMTFAVIDTGVFRIGSPTNDSRLKAEVAPRSRLVRLTQPFVLGVHEVTQAEFRQVMKHDPSWFAVTGGGRDKVPGKDTDPFPVEQVTWFDAVAFCNELSKLDKHPPYYSIEDVTKDGAAIVAAKVTVLGGTGYRLPSEAEWEYACRAGTITRFHCGHNLTGKLANVKSYISTGGYGSSVEEHSLGRTTAVGSYPANGWGLRDTHGNVDEWCGDWYAEDYYVQCPPEDPPGPADGRHRVLRGGSWLMSDQSARSSARFWRAPEEPKFGTGFRVARTP